MTVTDLSTLPPITTQRGGDPTLLRDELLHVIAWGIGRHPRSLQTRLGPSEIGHPCGRRLAYKLAGVEPVNTGSPPWRPTVGTAVHTWLQHTFHQSNSVIAEASGEGARWLVEMRVDVGEVGGEIVDGSCDLYDRVTATVVDWKIVGPTSLRHYRASGPGEQYRKQAHLYGRGWTRRGLPVDTVAICCLPSNGELRDAVWWAEPYDERVAVDALTRVEAIKSLVDSVGVLAPALLPTADAYCTSCPFYVPAVTELTTACPGHPISAAITRPAA